MTMALTSKPHEPHEPYDQVVPAAMPDDCDPQVQAACADQLITLRTQRPPTPTIDTNDLDKSETGTIVHVQSPTASTLVQSQSTAGTHTYGYRAVSIQHSAMIFILIIIANSICGACLCIIFWGFSRNKDLMQWEKRTFNALTLLLSGTLGFGIGSLCDKVGSLTRGAILQRRAHSVGDIGYIVQGELAAYTELLWRQLCRPTCSRKSPKSRSTLFLVFIFVFLSVLGRLGVALIGFAYNLDETPVHTPALLRPDWLNGSLSTDQFDVSIHSNQERVQHRLFPALDSPDDLVAVADFARATRSPLGFHSKHPNNGSDLEQAREISQFETTNLILHTDHSTRNITSIYHFQDIKPGEDPIPAGWDGVINVDCARFRMTTSNGQPFSLGSDGFWHLSELTHYEDYEGNITPFGDDSTNTGLGLSTRQGNPLFSLKDTSSFRWLAPSPIERTPRAEAVEIWLLGMFPSQDFFKVSSVREYGIQQYQTISRYLEETQDYLFDTPLAFKCNVVFQDVPTDEMVQTKLDFLEIEHSINDDPSLSPNGPSVRRILSRGIYSEVRWGPVKGSQTLTTYPVSMGFQDDENLQAMNFYQDFIPTYPLVYSLGSLNRTSSERWLAAYIANDISNTLDTLYDVLRPIQLQAKGDRVQTSLEIKWWRLSAILGGLTLFQVLFAVAAVLFSRGKITITDDVATLANMFENLPRETDGKKNGDYYRGRFEEESGGYIWDFEKAVPASAMASETCTIQTVPSGMVSGASTIRSVSVSGNQ